MCNLNTLLYKFYLCQKAPIYLFTVLFYDISKPLGKKYLLNSCDS